MKECITNNPKLFTKENFQEMCELIDGAYDLVFIFKVDNSPYNKKWRENWLRKAKKYGAGLDL